MRFCVAASDPRVHALVVALDRDGNSIAETWRAVGDAAWELGLRRPSYFTIRALARAERTRRRARTAARRAALDVLTAATSSRVVDLPVALDALERARARERLVLEQHKPP
jgi:hypothetical protein